ncbi:MAG TPA: amidohydrolase family protein, partial [Chryseosolibacter sp.]
MKLIRAVLFLFILSSVFACNTRQVSADLVILGGKIYTVNDRQPVVDAVAVKDGRILFAGSEEEARRFAIRDAKVVDLQGRIMTPGFIEGHGHMMGVGYNEVELDLMAVKSYDELVDQVKRAVEKAKPGDWIVGRGWHQDKWDHLPENMVKGFQTHHLLSAASPENPVFLRHASGHAALANAKAMEIAGVNQLSVERVQAGLTMEGGEIIRDALGNPTGIFNETAMRVIDQHIPENTASSDTKAFELALV